MNQPQMLVGIVAVSWLPWFDKKEDPPPTVLPEPEVIEVIEEPAPPPEPPAPVLFPDALPFHPTLDVTGLGMTYASSCAGCHNTAFAQWNDSSHHLGAQNTDWLDAIREFGDGTVCTSCHRPFDVQHEELTTEIIENDIARPVMEANSNWNPTWHSESVGCASCHVREGVVIGSITSDSPHAVRNSDTIQTSEACQTCHQFQLPEEETPIYNTYQEWKNSAYSSAGIQCQDCHMTTGSIIGTGVRNHNMQLSAAQGITVTFQTPSFILRRNQEHGLSVILHNTGVGHTWPGSSPFSTKQLIVRLMNDDGKKLIKDVVHPIGNHRSPDLTGPSIGVGNQHIFESALKVSGRIKDTYGKLQVVYSNGTEEEVLHSVRVEIR